MMNFEEIPVFTKDFEKLHKKYPSLPEDFERFKKALQTDQNSMGLLRLQLGNEFAPFKIFKAKKFRCKSLQRGVQSGMRIILEMSQKSEDYLVTFIEIYYKGQQENADMNRIHSYCRERQCKQ